MQSQEENKYGLFSPEIKYPYPLVKDPIEEQRRLEQMKQNQVGTVSLHGIRMVSLVIDCKERLCLAQISNTLLKEFSYNEIHNRRVALGITCVQCTPVQLEILRRAGAMPISSRRCGMITRREAERLCKSFLGDNSPPRLPDNFAFEIYHECAWGCRGQFSPSRYNSSRAKCIKCIFCTVFFSPNKFVFHSHRITDDTKYIQPDAANFNSWRRHICLVGDPPDEVVHAWEDVKAMFNGGTRKRMLPSGDSPTPSFSSESPLLSPPLPKQVKQETISEPELSEPIQSFYKLPNLPTRNIREYLWPRPQYPFLWPDRPLAPPFPHPGLPAAIPGKDTLFQPNHTQPFLDFFFSNNNSNLEREKKRTSVSEFMDGPFFRPGFRESAFQPFNKGEEEKEEKKRENNPAELDEEDSEGDEVVDIERIEDREEDRGEDEENVQVEEKDGSRTEDRDRREILLKHLSTVS